MMTIHTQLLNLLGTAQRMHAQGVHSLAHAYREAAFHLVSEHADPDQFDVMHVALCEDAIRVDVRVHTLVNGVMRTSRHNVRIKGVAPARIAVSGSDEQQQKPYLLEVFSNLIEEPCAGVV